MSSNLRQTQDPTTRLIRLSRRFTNQSLSAARQLAEQLSSMVGEANEAKRERVRSEIAYLDAARTALLTGDRSFPKELDQPTPGTISVWENKLEWLERYQEQHGDLDCRAAVDAYVDAYAEASIEQGKCAMGSEEEQALRLAKANSLNPETVTDGTARPAFMLARFLREESRTTDRWRTIDELWMVAVGVLVATSGEMSMADLGFPMELPVGFSSVGDGDLFSYRDGVATYAGILARDKSRAGELVLLAEFVASRLEALTENTQADTPREMVLATGSATAAGSLQKSGATNAENQHHETSSLPASCAPKQESALHSPPELPLRGWNSICRELEIPCSRSTQRHLKNLNADTKGPIRWSKRRPEVKRSKLLAWIRETEHRNEQASRTASSKKAASKELAERDGQRAADYGMHSKSRMKPKVKQELLDPYEGGWTPTD